MHLVFRDLCKKKKIRIYIKLTRLFSTFSSFLFFVPPFLFFFFNLQKRMTQTAPAPSLDFSINAEQVEKITSEIIAEELAVNDEVAALKPEEQTYENIVVRLARIENELSGKSVASFFFFFFFA
jgi:hypothetical protein